MNCEEFQTIVGAEPNSTHPDVLAHIERCPECARYREEMQAMDRLIYRALAVEAPAENSTPRLEASPLESSRHGPGRFGSDRRAARSRVWQMAASVLVTVLVGTLSLWLLTPRESFAQEAITHVMHEQASLVRTSETVDQARLEEIMSAAGVRLKPGATRVSYAQYCEFRGQRIPHLVVQTPQGPVTVLVVTHAAAQEQQQIDEDGFQGMIMPAPRGVIVVLGRNVPVDDVAWTVLSALQY